jgi:hypothetical protein
MLRLKIYCSMNFRLYPFDTQVCYVGLAILPYGKKFKGLKDLYLDWHKTPELTETTFSKKTVLDSNWDRKVFVHWRNDDREKSDSTKLKLAFEFRVSKAVCGNSSVLQRDETCTFQRSSTSHVAQSILPSVMMVLTSFCSFLVPVEQVVNGMMARVGSKKVSNCTHFISSKIPGRMGLTITTLLTLVAMSNGVFQNSPRTSYLKSIDIWLLGCFTFAFTVLVVYAILISMNHVF